MRRSLAKGMVGGLIVYTVAALEDALDDWAVNWGKVVFEVGFVLS